VFLVCCPKYIFFCPKYTFFCVPQVHLFFFTWDTFRNSFFSFTNLRLSQEWLRRVNSARSVVGANLVVVVYVSSIQVLRIVEDQTGAQDRQKFRGKKWHLRKKN
jgi:hypothetical protein